MASRTFFNLGSIKFLHHDATIKKSIKLNSITNYMMTSTVNNSQLINSRFGEKSGIFDIVIIGGGIVGITTARALLLEHPNLNVAVVEKEKDVAMHQTGHNSGVIHAGVYYQPNSLKANLCKEGLRQTYAFCDKYRIPYKKCGKLIVATNNSQTPQLNNLYKNALINEVPDVQLISGEKIQEIEPHCRGVQAIYSPHTGIIDWALFTRYCAKDFQNRGGTVFCDFEVKDASEARQGKATVDVSECPIVIRDTKGKTLRSKYVITCAGLHSDKVAKLLGGDLEPKILPFRGEYFELKENKRHLVKGNIYPVPDPRFPFLGVHFTPRLDGRILIGPNAILALSREGYRWNNMDRKEIIDILLFDGFWQLIPKYGRFGINEMLKSFSKFLYVRNLQAFIPSIKTNDIEFKGYTGVRAQAVNNDGTLVDDMILEFNTQGIQSRILHCRNAPSPAATSSLALAEYICKAVFVEFDL